MSAPLCPALLAAGISGALATEEGVRQLGMGSPLEWATCAGSRCAKWVPESGGRGSEIGPMLEGGDGAPVTGRGWCSDNLRRPAFADPAGVS